MSVVFLSVFCNCPCVVIIVTFAACSCDMKATDDLVWTLFSVYNTNFVYVAHAFTPFFEEGASKLYFQKVFLQGESFRKVRII